MIAPTVTPPADLIDAIVAQVVRRHPNGFTHLERAVREAAELGWRACDAITEAKAL